VRDSRLLPLLISIAVAASPAMAAGRTKGLLQRQSDAIAGQVTVLRAASIDMSGDYRRAIREAIPNAETAFDPFNVVRLAAPAEFRLTT
jgi:transposase